MLMKQAYFLVKPKQFVIISDTPNQYIHDYFHRYQVFRRHYLVLSFEPYASVRVTICNELIVFSIVKAPLLAYAVPPASLPS
jgi:hypothetical protein